MSLFDSASLVVTPNGYKEDKLYSIKPSDGSGDLVVTRATTATRVNSDGLIEVTPYNLQTYSQNFSNATWTITNGTATHSQTDPNGGSTATKIVFSSIGALETTLSGLSTSSNYTLLIYVKSESGSVNFEMGNIDGGSYVTRTATTKWQRFEFTQTPSGSTRYPSWIRSTGATTLYVAFAQAVTGTSAKEYFPTTDRLDVPRLDYTNSSCPSILVEPQRTNLVLRSQEFTNASWSSAGTIVDNVAISPDGTQNATEMSGSPYVYQGNTFGICTVSCYFKKTTSNTIGIRMDTTEVNYITFNINTGIVADVPSGFTASITSVGNGWYRCSATSTAAVGLVLFISPCYIWGAQCEAGSYATSYIPTQASSVTRNADLISKTGISSLIGQTEGTMFIDFNIDKNKIDSGSVLVPLGLYQSSTKSELTLYSDGRVQATHFNSGTLTCNIDLPSYGLTNGNHKIAFGYKANDFVLYIDGSLAGTDTSGTVGAQDSISLKDTTYPSVTNDKTIALWKTRLSNTELATLTTI